MDAFTAALHAAVENGAADAAPVAAKVTAVIGNKKKITLRMASPKIFRGTRRCYPIPRHVACQRCPGPADDRASPAPTGQPPPLKNKVGSSAPQKQTCAPGNNRVSRAALRARR